MTATSPELSVALSADEYRLALLGLVDFEGQWEALATAAAFVVDGSRKAALVQERLAPIASHLPALLKRKVDAFEMIGLRHWFRHMRLDEAPDPEEAAA
jgi:hypothetical protein